LFFKKQCVVSAVFSSDDLLVIILVSQLERMEADSPIYQD